MVLRKLDSGGNDMMSPRSTKAIEVEFAFKLLSKNPVVADDHENGEALRIDGVGYYNGETVALFTGSGFCINKLYYDGDYIRLSRLSVGGTVYSSLEEYNKQMEESIAKGYEDLRVTDIRWF